MKIFLSKKIFDQKKLRIFFWRFFSKKKIFFFDRIFFKVHLKIQEIRFLRFPDRCGGPEKSYEPSKTRKYTKIMIFGRNRVWVPFEKYSETGTQKSSSEKNVTKKKLFWKTFFFGGQIESSIFQRTRAH